MQTGRVAATIGIVASIPLRRYYVPYYTDLRFVFVDRLNTLLTISITLKCFHYLHSS